MDAELTNAWDVFRIMINHGVEALYSAIFISLDVLNYLSILSLFVWPMFYLLCYQWGPLSFDNVPSSEKEKPEASRTSIKKTFVTVPAWIPRPRELWTIIRSVVFTLDVPVIVVVILIDYYYTGLINWIYDVLIDLFDAHGGSIFEHAFPTDAAGITWIGFVIAQQLDALQHSAGMYRLKACIQPPPPADFSYLVFVMRLCQQVIYLYVKIKCPNLPVIICNRFYPHRYKLRTCHLQAREFFKKTKRSKTDKSPVQEDTA